MRPAIIFLFAACGIAQAQPDLRLWDASFLTLTAAHSLDLQSSWGNWANRERSPLLRGPDGRFSPQRAVPIKAAVLAGSFFLQRYSARRSRPLRIVFTVVNFGSAAYIGSVAARNYQVRRSYVLL